MIGLIAGWLYLFASSLLIRLRIDDAVDAIPVHMFNGIWGVFATGLFASPRKMELAYGEETNFGWFYHLGDGSFNARLLGAQVVTILFIFGWVLVTMMPFFVWLNYKGWLRADSLEELVGLDISYHGGMDSKEGGVKKEYVEVSVRQGFVYEAENGSGVSYVLYVFRFDSRHNSKYECPHIVVLQAYKKHKGTIRQRRLSNRSTGNSPWMTSGGDMTQEDAAAEAFSEGDMSH